MRGQARDYDQWRQLGNAGWSWEDVLPYFKRSEDHVDGGDELHGAGGEWRVEHPRISWDLLDAFREAAAEVGIAKIDDFNRGDNEGSSYFQVNQRSGVRWNTARAFLRPVRSRPNLDIVTHARARRIAIEARDEAAGGRPGSRPGWGERTSRSGRGGRWCSRRGRSARRTSCR